MDLDEFRHALDDAGNSSDIDVVNARSVVGARVRRRRRRQRTGASLLAVVAGVAVIVVLFAVVGTGRAHESVTVSPSTKVVYGSLPPRSGAAIAYDQARHQVVLFGGFDSSRTLADTWLWDGHGWIQARPPIAPPARQNAAMAYNPITKEVVLFGGTAQPNARSSIALSDTWVWNGTAWATRSPVHQPPWSDGLAMSYDPRSRSVLLLTLPSRHPNLDLTPDGASLRGVAPFGTWRWDGADWHELPTPTAPLFATAAAAFHVNPRLATLPHGAGLLFYSWATYTGSCPDGASCGGDGRDPSGTRDSQTWTWNGIRWTEQHPHRAPVGGQLIASPGDDAAPTIFTSDGAIWRWTGSDWHQTPARGAGPPTGDGFAVYDDLNTNIVAYAGRLGSDGVFYDTWTWDGSWTKRVQSNTPATKPVPAVTGTAPTVSAPGSCTSTQLRLSLARYVGSVMNQPAAYFGLTNRSTTACTLNGYPKLTLYDTSGQPISTSIGNGNAYQLNDPGAYPVTVQPHQSVYFGFGWSRQNPNGDGNGCVYVARVRVLVPNNDQSLTAAAPLNSAPVCRQSGGSVTAIAARTAFTITQP